MNWFTGVVLYVLIWWTVLFAVLPIGTRPVDDADSERLARRAASGRGSLMKVIVTTLVAGRGLVRRLAADHQRLRQLSATAGSLRVQSDELHCRPATAPHQAGEAYPPTCRVTGVSSPNLARAQAPLGRLLLTV